MAPRPAKRPAARRTQEERREATIRKLLDAGAEALIEVGYAGASVQEICARAGLSHGGLFRHFATREALLVAVGEDVGARLIARYRREFAGLGAQAEPLRVALELVRRTCRSRLNQAWYELTLAARTNPRLEQALEPVAAQYHANIDALARELLPELAASLGARFDVLVDTMIAVFDGETVRRFVLARPGVDEARVDALLALLAALVPPIGSEGARLPAVDDHARARHPARAR